MQKKRWLISLSLITTLIVSLLISPVEILASQRADQSDQWTQIKKRGTLLIGVDDSFVPMDFRKKNGTLVGYDVDLSRAVCKVLGLKPEFQSIDWAMKETELKNGTIDVIWNGYTATPARAKQQAFSRVYERSGQSLVVRKDAGINSFADMKGKVVGLQQGSTAYTDFYKYPAKLKRYVKGRIIYQDNNSAFLDLKAGRIDGVLTGTVYGGYYAKHLAGSNDYKLIGSDVFPQDEVAVGIRKKDRTLVKKINYALKVLQKDGTLRQINKKWLGIDTDYLGPVDQFK